jgi:hypothetical protein
MRLNIIRNHFLSLDTLFDVKVTLCIRVHIHLTHAYTVGHLYIHIRLFSSVDVYAYYAYAFLYKYHKISIENCDQS